MPGEIPISCLYEVVPLDGQAVYQLPGGLSVYASLIPPGLAIGVNLPPVTILLNVVEILALLDAIATILAEL